MNILITGSTGFIGQQLIHRLIVEGHQIKACTRQKSRPRYWPASVEHLAIQFSAMTDHQDWLPLLRNVDVVINAAGIIAEAYPGEFECVHAQVPRALFTACAEAGVGTVIQISALGASLEADTEYFASKAKADTFLQQLDLNWWVFKPSFVYGVGAKSLALLTALSALPFTPLADDGQQMLQPVSIEDITDAVIIAISATTPGRQSINLVGPEPISLRRIHELIAQRLNQPFHALEIPLSCLLKTMPLLKLLGEPAINPDSMRILQQGNQADASPFARFLGRSPRSFNEYAQQPAPLAERWYAKLYWLKPLFIWSVALVWIWSGVVSAMFYPVQDSYALLARVGIDGIAAPLVLYAASATDVLFGVALLRRWHLRGLIYSQLALMLTYSVAVSLYLPEFWLHPFGPMIKNLPFAVASLAILALEQPKSID